MSLLEGHGDITMNRAGAELVPEAARFARVLRERRKRAGPAARLMQQLIGMDAKLRQYEQGERFIEAVEEERRAGAACEGLGGTGPASDSRRDPRSRRHGSRG